jgi:hypothetical protein
MGGGIWAYFAVGPGRTVDTSGIRPGMTMADVEEILGKPDEVVESGDGVAWCYGRTHIWLVGVPGRGSVVAEVTNGPRESDGKSNGEPKMKGPRGFGRPEPGDNRKGPGPEQPKPGSTEK